MKHCCRAYSLFELLASIAIIAVLGAILFTTYGPSVRQAKTSVCISNLQQLHHAMTLYRDDAGEYPMNNINWPGLQPYLGYTKLRCPVVVKPLSIGDYVLHGFLPDGLPETEAQRACMALRGPEYPLGFDFNHASPLAITSIDEAFLLVIRIGGSVQRIPWTRIDEISTEMRKGSDLPCPDADEIDNL